MKASELRIGNYALNENGDVVQFCEARFRIMLKGVIKYKPIPLTEEWLVKFGFIEVSNGQWQDVETEIMVDLFNETISIISAMPWKQLKHIKHVHQLQNLYFALTNEEL